jgi:hypothetical protein
LSRGAEIMNKIMENDKGAKMFLRPFENGVEWTLHYNGHIKKWNVSGSINTSVKVWKDNGFRVKENAYV